jgi:hypothetical protein
MFAHALSKWLSAESCRGPQIKGNTAQSGQSDGAWIFRADQAE